MPDIHFDGGEGTQCTVSNLQKKVSPGFVTITGMLICGPKEYGPIRRIMRTSIDQWNTK
jgi:hypothetical protein